MAAADDVHVQLRDLVAERGDVELVAFGDALERARGRGDFAEQLHLLVLLKVDEFDQRRPARHQDQPGIIGVVGQQHAREREIADRNRVLGEFAVEGPDDSGMLSSVRPAEPTGPREARPDDAPLRLAHAPPSSRMHGDESGRFRAMHRPLLCLAFRHYWPDIGRGRLAVDEPLANRVRSGRKQP